MMAVILESGDLARLYTALSLLVSAASGGEPARGLASFGALDPLLDPDLEARALADGRGETFARTLAGMRDFAREHEDCRLWACAAALEATGAQPGPPLDGVMSTPLFLREVEGARLVVV